MSTIFSPSSFSEVKKTINKISCPFYKKYIFLIVVERIEFMYFCKAPRCFQNKNPLEISVDCCRRPTTNLRNLFYFLVLNRCLGNMIQTYSSCPFIFSPAYNDAPYGLCLFAHHVHIQFPDNQSRQSVSYSGLLVSPTFPLLSERVPAEHPMNSS